MTKRKWKHSDELEEAKRKANREKQARDRQNQASRVPGEPHERDQDHQGQ